MKYHVQLLERKLDGSIDDSLGSFSVAVVDGRYSRDNMMNCGHELLARERRRGDWFIGFSLRAGPRFTDCREVARYIMPEARS